MLLSPLDPLKELADYTCYDKMIHWLFCGKCGSRCFLFASRNGGKGDVVEKTVPIWNAVEARFDGEEKRKVWVVAKDEDEWREGVNLGYYLSVNGYTLEAKQEGLDLRQWKEDGLVGYVDSLDDAGEEQYERPHVGGSY